MNSILPFEYLSDDTPPPLIHGYISVQGDISVFGDAVEAWPDSSAPVGYFG